MMIIKNAIRSITRSKGRNILIGIIVLTIAVSSCVALSIRSAADKARSAGMDSINITASINVDRDKIMEEANENSTGGKPDMDNMRSLMDQYGALSLKELKTYANSKYVKDFYYSASASLDGSGSLEAFTESDTSSDDDKDGENQQMGPGAMPEADKESKDRGGMTMGDFTLVGYGSESAMSEFLAGTSKISDGAMFDVDSSKKECIINSELAAYNDLKVGDKIKLADPSDSSKKYTFKITGIYANSNKDSSEGPKFGTAMDPANQIYTSHGALKSTGAETQLSGIYTFDNRADYDSFSTQVTAKGLSKYYTVTSTDIDNFEASLVPLDNLSNFAGTLLMIVLIVGAVILIVLNIFNIRERNYEVGVLTAIGIKKGKVAMQFVAELLIITLISLTVGTCIGAAISGPISNNLLKSQIASQQTAAQEQNQNFGREPGQGGPGGPEGSPGNNRENPASAGQVQYVDSVDTQLEPMTLLNLAGIGILLTILSSLGAVVFVLRYEPLQILANRS